MGVVEGHVGIATCEINCSQRSIVLHDDDPLHPQAIARNTGRGVRGVVQGIQTCFYKQIGGDKTALIWPKGERIGLRSLVRLLANMVNTGNQESYSHARRINVQSWIEKGDLGHCIVAR
jgi:hypothetical protein